MSIEKGEQDAVIPVTIENNSRYEVTCARLTFFTCFIFDHTLVVVHQRNQGHRENDWFYDLVGRVPPKHHYEDFKTSHILKCEVPCSVAKKSTKSIELTIPEDITPHLQHSVQVTKLGSARTWLRVELVAGRSDRSVAVDFPLMIRYGTIFKAQVERKPMEWPPDAFD
jgi:hypothetical protein